jgi:hypothetical protein
MATVIPKSGEDLLKSVKPLNLGDQSSVSTDAIGSIREFKFKQPTQLPTNITQQSSDLGSIDEHSNKPVSKNFYGADTDASEYDPTSALATANNQQETDKILNESYGDKLKRADAQAEKKQTEEREIKAEEQTQEQQNKPKQSGNPEQQESQNNQPDNALGSINATASAQAATQSQTTDTAQSQSTTQPDSTNPGAQTPLPPLPPTQTPEQKKLAQAKMVKEAASKRTLAFNGLFGPVWTYVVITLVLVTITFSFIAALLAGANKDKAVGGGEDGYFYTGYSSPDSCSRSAVESVYGIAAANSLKTLSRDIFGPEKINNPNYQTLEALNQYAKYASITVQATSNLIRTGSARDTSADKPLEAKDDPYGSGVTINDTVADLINSYINVPVDATKSDDQTPATPTTNVLNYDADTAKMKIEAIGAVLKSSLTGYEYDLPKIQYVDATTPQELTGGTTAAGNRTIQGGDIADRDGSGKVVLSAPLTRKLKLNESYGITTQDFLTPPPAPAKPPFKVDFKYDTDSPETDTVHYQRPYTEVTAGNSTDIPTPTTDPYVVRDYLTDEELNAKTSASSTNPPTGADARLTDGTMVSFNSLTVAGAIKLKVLGFRIPIVSDILEFVINLIVSNILRFDLIKTPVLSTSYYRMANIGSFGSNLLNNFESNDTNPFSKYSGHTAYNDRNDAARGLYDQYFAPGVNDVKLTPNTNLPIVGSSDPNASKPSDDDVNNAVNSDPTIKKYKEAQQNAQKSLETASSPEVTKLWQSKTGPGALRVAMSNITDLFLQAGNQPRKVSGINASVIINLGISYIPPAAFTIEPFLPTLSGLYAEKTVTNGPTGREYVNLYNRVGVAVLKASTAPTWPKDGQYSFNSGAFADGNEIAKGVESWMGECKATRYDVPLTGGGTSSALTQVNGLNSCKLYERNENNEFATNDQYLPRDPNKYLTQDAKDKLTAVGIKNRRDYYESIIIAEAIQQGINPKTEIGRTTLAEILALAAYQTNRDYKTNNRRFQSEDFARFSEINPLYFKPIGDLVSDIGKKPIGEILDEDLIKPFSDRIDSIKAGNAAPTSGASISNRDGDIIVVTQDTIAGVNETYGPLGKAVTDAAQGLINTIAIDNLTGLIGKTGVVEVKTDFKAVVDRYNKVAFGDAPFGGFFAEDVTRVSDVSDSNLYGVSYYGRGLLPDTIRGRGIYKKLDQTLNSQYIYEPNKIRDNPSAMAQTLIAGLKNGVFTGYRLSDFFTPTKSDPINAQALVNPNYVFTKKAATDLDAVLNAPDIGTPIVTGEAIGSAKDPNRNVDQTIPDKFIIERYKYYFEKLRTVPESFYTAANQSCESAPDGKIFKNITDSKACIKEGFNTVNSTDIKNPYQSYGYTISAEGPIYPLFGGKILYSNFATKKPETTTTKEDTTKPKVEVDENALKQRRNKNDPVNGNQLSIISYAPDASTGSNAKIITRYTNLDGVRLPSIGVAPGTPVNKDDIIGYMGNSGSKQTDASPKTVSVEIYKYYGGGLEQKIEDIFADAKSFGNFENPLYYIKNQLTSKDQDAMPFCAEEVRKTANYSSAATTPSEGITVPGFGNTPLDTWLILR